MRFNTKKEEEGKVRNHEGAEAFVMSPESELYTAVVTASLSDKFYESNDERMNRIVSLITKVDPLFVAQLAVYTRTQMYLRSVPLLLLVELAKVHSGDDLVSHAVAQTILRADEITELLACYQSRNPSKDKRKKLGKLSHQIQVGLQQAFNRFDEYQFAKYDRDGVDVKLRDALFLVHPKAKDEAQQALFDKITNKSLAVPYTWETELSALGQQKFENDEERATAFRKKWEELIDSGKVGYMALMRNLRNILESRVSTEHILKVCNTLSDPKAVANAKQLPFRYLAAYREVREITSTSTATVLSALEEATLCSAANIEGFGADTKVLLACDVSGSMCRSISPRSKVENYDIGLMLAMMLKSHCSQVFSGIFGNTWLPINLPQGSILANTNAMRCHGNKVGFSTNGHLVIDWLIERKEIMDKVMMFTDCQMWDSYGGNASIKKSWHHYKTIAPNAKLYLFDLAGYGQMPLSMAEKDVYLIAGWSDKIFEVLQAIEEGGNAIEMINNVKI
jgi:hypothetical protein